MPEVVDYNQVAADQERAEEIRDPGCTARKAAARERERIVREARATTERQYREVLTIIAKGEQPDPVELTRLATALGRSTQDVSNDVEDRAAEMENEAEAARCDEERADLEQQVAQEDSRIEKARAEQSNSASEYRNLEAEIARQHAKVAKKEKAALAEALQRNQAATATIEHATANVHQLQARLQNVRPACNHVEEIAGCPVPCQAPGCPTGIRPGYGPVCLCPAAGRVAGRIAAHSVESASPEWPARFGRVRPGRPAWSD